MHFEATYPHLPITGGALPAWCVTLRPRPAFSQGESVDVRRHGDGSPRRRRCSVVHCGCGRRRGLLASRRSAVEDLWQPCWWRCPPDRHGCGGGTWHLPHLATLLLHRGGDHSFLAPPRRPSSPPAPPATPPAAAEAPRAPRGSSRSCSGSPQLRGRGLAPPARSPRSRSSSARASPSDRLSS